MDFQSDRMQEIAGRYRKVLYVNLDTGKYKPIHVDNDEWNVLRTDKTYKLEDYILWFMQSGLLCSADVKQFVDFVNNIRHCDDYIIYRRYINNALHRVIMEITPCNDKNSCLLYVRDIEFIYEAECEKILDTVCSIDTLTGLRNRYGFSRDVKNLQGNVGIVYCDLNSLKLINDTQGHKAGDNLICKFSAMLQEYFPDDYAYRFGGDEFVVVCNDESVRAFHTKAETFYDRINEDDKPLASIGYSVDICSTLSLTFNEAERMMYCEKQSYYEKFPNNKR